MVSCQITMENNGNKIGINETINSELTRGLVIQQLRHT